MFNLIIMDRERSNHLKIRKYIDEAKLDYKVVGTATSVQQAERHLNTKEVDLLIGDDGFVGTTGLGLFNKYKDQLPNLHAWRPRPGGSSGWQRGSSPASR